MTCGVPLLVSYHFAFSYCSWGSQGKNSLAIPFSSGPHSVRPLQHDPPILDCPAGMAWFHWVRQGCGPSVIRLTSFLWVWLECVCLLTPSCNTYHLTWFLLPWAWGISSRLLQQSAATAPYLGWRVSLYTDTYITWVWVNSRSWWWTGRPGVLKFMGSQRVRQDWATEQNWIEEGRIGNIQKNIFLSHWN